MIIIAFAAGTLGLIISMAMRRNTPKARKWETSGGILDESFVYMSLPGFSLLLLGLGIAGIMAPLLGGNFGWLGLLGFTLGFLIVASGTILTGWGLFTTNVPTWALPEWKR